MFPEYCSPAPDFPLQPAWSPLKAESPESFLPEHRLATLPAVFPLRKSYLVILPALPKFHCSDCFLLLCRPAAHLPAWYLSELQSARSEVPRHKPGQMTNTVLRIKMLQAFSLTSF